jgi:hypothetical protein
MTAKKDTAKKTPHPSHADVDAAVERATELRNQLEQADQTSPPQVDLSGLVRSAQALIDHIDSLRNEPAPPAEETAEATA